MALIKLKYYKIKRNNIILKYHLLLKNETKNKIKSCRL